MNRQLYIYARAAGRICTFCLFIWLSCPANVQATTYYVKPDGSDSNDGLSWAQAFQTLQKAIETASPGDEIWVAAGTYLPTKDASGNDSPGDSRTKTFFIDKDIKIYGGFAGTETMLSKRNWVTYVTTLSGDIGTSGNNSDNCYHVVHMKNLTPAAVLDGFTITGGYANSASFPQDRGSGIYNDGSGSGNSSNPTIANCSFSGNVAFYGGAVYNYGYFGTSSPGFTNCSFSGNDADFGGAVYNDGYSGTSSPSFTNCSFSGNNANSYGGAVYNYGYFGTSSPGFTNCSFSGNDASAGGAVYNYGYSGTSSSGFTNCILWGNASEIYNDNATSSVSYSIVQGGYSPCTSCPGGNGNVDPLFVSQPAYSNAPTTAGDLHLQAGSPAIDVGNNADVPLGITTDLDGNPRFNNSTVDLGAFEYQSTSCPATSTTWFVNAAAAPGGNGASWACAFQNLQDAIDAASAGDEIWVAAGTYLPTKDTSGNASPGDSRTKTFFIDKDIEIYGGFAGTETMLSQRDWVTYVTTLSGDIGTSGDNNDNCYHVVHMQYLSNMAVLDGFTITEGNANGSSPNNYGGGIYNDGSGSGNSSNPSIANCSFSGNNANSDGGAVYNDGNGGTSSPSFTNCILWGNASEIYNDNATPTVSYSIVQGGYSPCMNCPGTNGNVDPLFVNQPAYSNAPTTDGDLHLQTGSPAIDAGTSTGAPANDLDGNPRPSICAFDLGAYEFQGSVPLPTASCKDATIEVDSMGNVTLSPSDVDNGSMAPCGLQGLSVAPSAFNCSHVGTPQSVTLTVTDVNNNSATCSATVTVQDNTPPVAACLNPTIALGANGQASISTADVFDTANSSDNCDNPYPVFVTPNTFTCADIGADTVTLQIIDLHGNTALCNATVTVVDNIAPTVTCKNTSVTLNSLGQASLQPIEVYDSGNDNCGTVNLESVSPSSFDCDDVGANTVTLTVSDGHGNTATCTASVSVNDNMAPTAKCKNHSVALDANGQASIMAADVNDGSSDNCGIGNLSVSPSSFGCADVGPNTVTLTVSDAQGNSATCTATVTVQDNTPPTALCQNFTTNLDPDGTYTLAPSSIDNGSSDNCSVSLSVSPSQFDCGEIGANTVTLTATDPSGNTATCSATLTINPFVVINSVSTTDETCQGYSDGTITINATTLGGTLMYSINGGGSYQGLNTFTSVSPGTYSIVVLAQGTSGCSASANASVGAGPAPTTWYKDLDGDGYTDGITHVSCSPPAGYVGSAIPGDCNDNDAAVNPGATEACNGLDDNCDGIIPADEQDNDADGYRLCDGDCNDSNPAINPGAAEICNGIDDNCDSQIDEGNPPANQVYVGNVIFTSQAAVDNFSNCYYKIQSNLTISGPGINSLANLYNLQEVTGNVLIQVTSLPNMNGLDGLTTIGGSLTIKLNNYGAKLTSLSGLGNLTSIGQNLFIYFNFSLSDCCSIDDLLANAGVGGSISIHHNATGCNSVSDISTTCSSAPIIVIPGNDIAFGEGIQQPRMSLFPNPATTEVTVLLEGLGDKTGTLVISDLLGRTILQRRLEPGQEVLELDLEGQAFGHGIYLVALRSDEVQLVQRLVIER